MRMEYPILMDGNEIGKADIVREGLFLKIRCTCHIPYEDDLRIQMVSTDKSYDLGMCVPGNACIELITRVSARLCIGEGVAFRLHKQKSECFQPIETEKQFEMLSMLRVSRYEIRDGVPGILISTYNEISKPTGQ